MVGQTKAMGQTEPQFLFDPMSDRKKKFSPTLLLISMFTFAPLSNMLWRCRAKKDVNKVHWMAFSKSKE